MTKIIATLLIATVGIFALACGSGDGAGTATADTGKTIKSGPAGNNLTATLASTIQKSAGVACSSTTSASARSPSVMVTKAMPSSAQRSRPGTEEGPHAP